MRTTYRRGAFLRIPEEMLGQFPIEDLVVWAYIDARSRFKTFNWQFSVERIAKALDLHVKRCRKSVRRLESANLLERRRILNRKREFIGMEYIIKEPVRDYPEDAEGQASLWDKVVNSI